MVWGGILPLVSSYNHTFNNSNRVTSVSEIREFQNQFSNQKKIYFLAENKGKIRKFHVGSGKKSGNFMWDKGKKSGNFVIIIIFFFKLNP